MHRSCILFRLAVPLLFVLRGLVFAQDAASDPETDADSVRIAWDLEQDDRFYVLETVAINQNIAVDGNNRNQKAQQTTLYEYNVKQKQVDGGVRIGVKIDSLKSDLADPEASAFFRRIEGATLTLVLDESLQVTSLEGYDAFAKQASGGDESKRRLILAVLPEQRLRDSLAAPLTIAPGTTVAPRGSWSTSRTLSLELFGAVDVTRTYTLGTPKKTTPQVVPFTVSGSGEYTPPQVDPNRLPFTHQGGELELSKLEGKGTFDTQTGRLVSLSLLLEIAGELTMGIGDETSKVKVKQTQETTLRVSSDKPGG